MANTSIRPKLATLDELLSHDFYKRLVSSIELSLPEMRDVNTPEKLVKSNFAKEVIDIYKTLFSGSFNKLDMASLEHSDYLSHLLPCLSMESFPLIANLNSKSQELFKQARFCSVMTCVWCFVESHSSGRSDYVDVLSNVSSRHKDSFETLFFNAAQLLMLESWNEDLCESRQFENVDRLTVLEQRAILRFLIICFQRIELLEVRRCCMSLLSPQLWIHIPAELRESNFFKNNKVSKLLFMKAIQNYKLKHDACNFSTFLKDKVANTNGNVESDNSVKSVYSVLPNSKNITNLNLAYRLILNRDFLNSIINQFIFILEDHLSPSEHTKDGKDKTSSDKPNEENYVMRLMYIENYLELFVDLLSQLHLRRIIKPIIEYRLILVRCKNHTLYQSLSNTKNDKQEGSIFVELVNILEYYLNFNINEELGLNMDFNVILEDYYKRFNKFQRICYLDYKNDENLKNIHLINNYSLNTNLSNILSNLDIGVLVQLNQKLLLIPSATSSDASKTTASNTPSKSNEEKGDVTEHYLWPHSIELMPKKKKSKKLIKKLLISNLVTYLKKPINELVLINKNNFYLNPFSSLFNSTTVVNPELSENAEPMDASQPLESNYSREDGEMVEIEEDMSYIKLSTLSLFKLNLQYLTLFDYLYRNFILYQFEIIYQIKQYIQQQVFILFSFCSQKPSFSKLSSGVSAEENRWVGRMFMGISNTAMSIVGKRVEMTLTLDLSLVQDYKIRQEWQQLTKYDILYLIQLCPNYSKYSTGNKEHDELLWGKDVRRIRFGEILEVLDEENNNVLDFNPLDKKSFMGFKMRVKLLLDYEQYMKDIQEDLDYYNSFNLVIRRSKRQNNFKAILTNVQNVLNNRVDIPNWLQVVLLGYIHNLTNELNKPKPSLPPKAPNTLNHQDKHNDDKPSAPKRRKYSHDKVGINYLNTFKSKQHLLDTTHFISIKLIPVLPNTDTNHDAKSTKNTKSKDAKPAKLNKNKPFDQTNSNTNPNSVYSEENLKLKENQLFIDKINNDLNEFVFNNKNNLNKKDLIDKVKSILLNNEDVHTFIENHLLSAPYNIPNNLTDSDVDKKHSDKFMVLDGVMFELYIDDGYLNGLNKLNNNYYIGNNQLPKFLISNFSNPYEIKYNKANALPTPDGANGLSSDADLSNGNNFPESSAATTDNSISGPKNLKESRHHIKFVNKQIESIVNGTLEGLTVIMGPPGTGKTDVVSQIISILFNNFEHEKIVICTHSNFALDDIFTKLVKNELIDEHYMVRLGHSDLELDQMGHFTKFGRVNYILQRRLDLLEVVKALKEQMNVTGDYECSIQYALTFLQYYFLNAPFSNPSNESNEQLLEKDRELLKGLDGFFSLDLSFPYTLKDVNKLYHQLQPYSTADAASADEVVTKKRAYTKFLNKLYEALNELLPFEILRNNRDRMKYLVENYSRIVAMTCTHASIAKEELATLNYKSLVFEEAAQILEIESFIPICSNIKRLVLCGDHLQLSPIIQHSALQKYSNLNQSLFLRLIRLNYPFVQLNVQARSKPEILDVYKNFYPNRIYTLGEEDLADAELDDSPDQSKAKKVDKSKRPATSTLTHQLLNQLRTPNVSLSLNFVVQFINVDGEETSPIRHFYQNLEEAQYCVSLYMLMRLMGLEDIVILTAYNGQKCLIEDVVKKRCSWNNKIGSPLVSTIDKYQGRQADYVIVSLVRTKNVGYLRDPRRFVVATSRSKLGLFIVGKKDLIQNIKELAVFNTQLNKYPNHLHLKLTHTNSHSNTNEANASNTPEQLLEVRNNKELEELVKVLM